jgi:hypothetical protein
MEIPIVRKVMGSFLPDWLKAMFVLVVSPVAVIYVLVHASFMLVRWTCTHKQLEVRAGPAHEHEAGVCTQGTRP